MVRKAFRDRLFPSARFRFGYVNNPALQVDIRPAYAQNLRFSHGCFKSDNDKRVDGFAGVGFRTFDKVPHLWIFLVFCRRRCPKHFGLDS